MSCVLYKDGETLLCDPADMAREMAAGWSVTNGEAVNEEASEEASKETIEDSEEPEEEPEADKKPNKKPGKKTKVLEAS